MRSAVSVDWHSLLEEDPVTHFVVLRETLLKSLPLSFGREKHAPCVDHGGPRGSEHSRQRRASHGGDWPPLRGHDGHLSSTWYCWQGGWQITQHPVGLPTALEEIWCGTFPAQLQQCVHDGRRCGHIGILSSSVLSLSSPSVRPKSVRVVSGRRFEELEHGATVGSSDGRWHGDVRIVASLVNQYFGSHRLLLVHHAAYPGISSLGVGLGFDVIAEDHHKFFKFISL